MNPLNNLLIHNFKNITIGLLIVFLSGFVASCATSSVDTNADYGENRQSELVVESFDGQRAFQDLTAQVDFGPRTPGSIGYENTKAWLIDILEEYNWDVQLQEFDQMGNSYTNIIASNEAEGPPIILGAHFDTRILSDEDPNPEFRTTPVPGANDGASGVAVLTELARVIPDNYEENIWLVFFDAEDNGRIEGLDWIMGSTYFADNLNVTPEVVVIVDMIGDEDLNIYYERNSSPEYRAEIWASAQVLGFEEAFIAEEKYKIIDDHLPFIQRGIPAVDLIDFDYEYYHTSEDTLDKVSPDSLEMVGKTLIYWLINY